MDTVGMSMDWDMLNQKLAGSCHQGNWGFPVHFPSIQ